MWSGQLGGCTGGAQNRCASIRVRRQKAGVDILRNMDGLDLDGLRAILDKKEVTEALAVLNVLNTEVDRDEDKLHAALRVLWEKCNQAADLEDTVIKATIAASRLYLMGMHLLPFLAAAGDPRWWYEKLPAELLENARGHKWQAAPSDPQKMLRALAAMMQQKVEERESYGRNDAASLFAKKAKPRKAATAASDSVSSAEGGADSSSSSAAEKAKKKKTEKGIKDKDTRSKKVKKSDKKDKKTKKKSKKAARKGKSSSPSTGSSTATKRKAAKAAAVAAARKAAKTEATTIKVRRVTGARDGKAIVKEDDLFDELPKDANTVLQTALEELFTQQSSVEELKNWSVHTLAEDGTLQPADTSLVTGVCGDIALLRRGG